MYFGLSPKEVRKLAFEYAVKLELKIPKNWTQNKEAGVDWFSEFLKRNSSISIRRPEATSLSRAMNFNKVNVKNCMDKYQSVLLKYKFEGQDIYNLDETGITTVQRTEKVVASRGKKQIGAITSAERGTLVTMCLAVNAIGNFIPPMFVFPRVNYKDYFVRGGPSGCVGVANKSGWTQGNEFLEFVKHFAKHVKPSVDKKVLVLLDNHESHLYLPVIDFCREVGIVLLSFPPHCSHKLQPLDRSVYGPFKKYINQNMTSWMTNNPGKRITIYDVPSISSNALVSAATPRNIINGFSVSGIWPFNMDAFTEDEFAPAVVTDMVINSTTEELVNTTTEELVNTTNEELVNTTTEELVYNITENLLNYVNNESVDSINLIIIDEQRPQNNEISPEHIKPYPKAALQDKLKNKGGRRKGKSAILTDTPEKIEIEQRTKVNAKRNIDFGKNKSKKRKQKIKKPTKVINNKVSSDDSDEEETYCLICADLYSNSKQGETWIQCKKCKLWAHEDCTNQMFTAHYTCENCEADDV